MVCEQEEGVLSQFRQRAISVLQVEGPLGLLRRIIVRLRRKPVHRSYYILALSLDNLVDPPLPKVDVKIKEIKATDDDELEALAEIEEWRKPKAHLLRRLAEGQHCYVAQHQSQIVACCWWLDGEFKDPTLDREFKLAASEVYMHSVFTTPAFRGKGILSYLDVQAGRDATRVQGKTRSLNFVEVTNKASLRSSAKGGRIRIGLIGFVEILGVRFHYFWGRNAFQEPPRRFFVERR